MKTKYICAVKLSSLVLKKYGDYLYSKGVKLTTLAGHNLCY